MDGRTIIWTLTALRQRNTIFEYWNKRNASKSYARKLNGQIRDRLSLLKQNPEIGIQTTVKGVRALSMKHYSIFYSFDNSTIQIVSFWDNRQNPERLLQLLKQT
ncbi:MAG TPA: plasmid stabilization protein [Flavobacteriales bacterium]|jgi:plasmid stabilization system protein ParE|nr:plasmid stabilization protein [Flavobacteriales bacterium]